MRLATSASDTFRTSPAWQTMSAYWGKIGSRVSGLSGQLFTEAGRSTLLSGGLTQRAAARFFANLAAAVRPRCREGQ
jgi:hypothetical protein